MKFEKIGRCGSSSKNLYINSKDIFKPNYLNFAIVCNGKKIKWDDREENDAINLIITWQVALSQDNHLPVWDRMYFQQYAIKEKQISVTDKDINDIIEDSLADFRTYLESENENPKDILANLNSVKVQDIRQNLLIACNSEIEP